jgi:hypothetical protein
MFGATSDFTIYNDALLASAILVKGGSSNVLVGTATDAGFKLDVNGTGRFNTSLTVGAGGLTGRLSVRGTTNDSSAFAFEAANSSGSSLFFVRNDGAATFSSSIAVGNAGMGLTGINLPNQNYLAWYLSGGSGAQNVAIRGNGNNLELSSGGGLTMTLDANQRVGIGTTSPQSKFEVVDGTGSVFRAINSGINNMEIGNYKAGGAGYQQLDIVSSILRFATGTAGGGSATERMRITSGGNVLIGTTTDVGGYKTVIAGSGGIIWATNGSANSQFALTTTNNLIITNNNSQGVILNLGATSWSAYSDIRLKNITSKITDALTNVLTLSPIRFTLKSDETKKERIGLIAQEIQKILPEAVDSDDKGMLSVRYTEIIPLLIASIQEQQTQIESLKSTLQHNNIL